MLIWSRNSPNPSIYTVVLHPNEHEPVERFQLPTLRVERSDCATLRASNSALCRARCRQVCPRSRPLVLFVPGYHDPSDFTNVVEEADKVLIVFVRSASPSRNFNDLCVFGTLPLRTHDVEDESQMTPVRGTRIWGRFRGRPRSSPLVLLSGGIQPPRPRIYFTIFPLEGFFDRTDATGKRGTMSALLRPLGSNAPLPDVPATPPYRSCRVSSRFSGLNLFNPQSFPQFFGSSFHERPRARTSAANLRHFTLLHKKPPLPSQRLKS